MTTLLELENVSKSYTLNGRDPIPVLDGISLSVAAGETAAVTGPSGSGKSTLLHLMGGLDTPSAGTVRLGGDDLSRLDDAGLSAKRNREIGFVFQDHYLLPQLTVIENVLVPVLASGRAGQEDIARAESLLQQVGLTDRLNHRPAQLSGGECQRVAVIRALINRPALLLADEPTGALDERNAAGLADLLFSLPDADRPALILVTHSADLAARASVSYAIHNGKLG